jgi:nitrous oxidase accessory protein NosD
MEGYAVRKALFGAGVLLALAVMAGVIAPETRAGLPADIFVDDDGVECPDADYTTIQAAVDAADPGNTIRVCAGTYAESVNVNKDVDLRGATGNGTGEGVCEAVQADTTYTIVDPPGTTAPGFNVTADFVQIRQMVITGAEDHAGIFLSSDHSGYEIRHNIIRDNTIGVYLGSDGDFESFVRLNSFCDNNASGAAAGNAIYSDQGVENVNILANKSEGNASAFLILVGGVTLETNQAHLTVRNNTLTGDGAVIVQNTDDILIERNTMNGSTGSAIFYAGGVTNSIVRRNNIQDCAFTGINLRVSAFIATAVNADNRISFNTVEGCGDAGIRLREGTTRTRVFSNTVNDTASMDGISVEASTFNLVHRNRTFNNNRDGLYADAGSTSNFFNQNRSGDNGEHDCHDDSTDGGSAGTANAWFANEGATDSPGGLCEPAAP